MNNCQFYKYISNAYVMLDWELYPEDFLNCDTIEELKDAVEEYFNENIDSGDFIIKEYDTEFTLPEDFINEWRKLKQNEI